MLAVFALTGCSSSADLSCPGAPHICRNISEEAVSSFEEAITYIKRKLPLLPETPAVLQRRRLTSIPAVLQEGETEK